MKVKKENKMRRRRRENTYLYMHHFPFLFNSTLFFKRTNEGEERNEAGQFLRKR